MRRAAIRSCRGVLPSGVAAALLVAGLAACAPNHEAPGGRSPGAGSGSEPAHEDIMRSEPSTDAAAKDTLRGTVAVVGSEPATRVVLRPVAGGAEIMLMGDAVRDLRRLAGVEVQVEGRAEDPPGGRTGVGAGSFVVERFAVRAVDGIPAVDGILVAEDDVVLLRRPDGELRRISQPPAALRTRIGAWVWIAGPLDDGVAAFGVIREAAR